MRIHKPEVGASYWTFIGDKVVMRIYEGKTDSMTMEEGHVLGLMEDDRASYFVKDLPFLYERESEALTLLINANLQDTIDLQDQMAKGLSTEEAERHMVRLDAELSALKEARELAYQNERSARMSPSFAAPYNAKQVSPSKSVYADMVSIIQGK